VFIDGCFWHGCPEHYVRPRSSDQFWSNKLRENVRRDADQTRRLEALGWRVCRVWEHEVFEQPMEIAARIESAVHGRGWRPGISWRVVRVVELDPQTNRERRCLRDLRNAGRRRTITRIRSTRKWRTAREMVALRRKRTQ
jgi:DNA mismatch endonuclease (patch repair protein)